MSKLYEADFYTWAMTQAEAARNRSANEFDWDNVAEELETLGRSQKPELYSRLAVLTQHLLKWAYQPQHRSRSWRVTIENQRRALDKHMRENPGLKQFEQAEFEEAYVEARANAALEMDVEETELPDAPPFTLAQARDREFWPERPASA